MRILRLIALVAIGALLSAVLAVLTPSLSSRAADANRFDPGNIMSDAVFFAGSAMSGNEVQAFLEGRVSQCRTGYTCLKNYRESTSSRVAQAGRCARYEGASSERASDIIARVGSACGISQKALIVLLEKEQGLVSDSFPGARQYRSATGYGCPDTADCDTQYYGFFNQVYAAALQFKNYAANPAGRNYQAGRYNTIMWSPTAGCGTSSVYIQNQATAGLYLYTPYRPNAAALANLYGAGDSCSAYGNRNFWRIYSDWFGDPQQGSSLVRTESNATVYVVSGSKKHAIPDLATYQALYPLGQLGYVSQTYLDGLTSGPALGRVIRSAAGKVYFFDVGAKLQFMTCGDVSAYGVECGASVVLTDSQINQLRNGPAMSRLYVTPEGKRFLMESGRRREVLDDASLAKVSSPANFVTLYEAAISYLPYGAPVVRDGASVQTRGTSAVGVLADGRLSPIPAPLLNQTPLKGRFPVSTLDQSSVAQLPVSPVVTGFMKDPNGQLSVLTVGGRIVVDAQSYTGIAFTTAPPAVLSALKIESTVAGPHFVKETSSSAVYLIAGGVKQRLLSWAAYETYIQTAVASGTIWTLPDGLLAKVPAGKDLNAGLASGSLVKSASSPKVYLVDGTSLRALSTFGISIGLGFGASFETVSEATIGSYGTPGVLNSLGVKCGPDFSIGIGGKVAPILDAGLVTAFGRTHAELSAATCAVIPKTTVPMTAFIRSDSGKIFWVDGGKKHPIDSWAALARLGGTDKWIQVGVDLLDAIPTGESIL